MQINKYDFKYDDCIYYNVSFDEIVCLLLQEDKNNFPMTNKLLLLEMLRLICVIEKKTLNIVNSDKYILNDLFDYNLVINDEKSIINLINKLEIAEIVTR